MEKLVISLWRPADVDGDTFRDQLLALAEEQWLMLTPIHGLRLTVVDSEVAAAEGRRIVAAEPPPDAVLSVWVDAVNGHVKLLQSLVPLSTAQSCYLVTESDQLADAARPAPVAGRTPGFCQVVFMQRPDHLSVAQWLDLWQGQHTAVAIETQATFAYRQNVIVRPLSKNTPPLSALVEESFPEAAMTSDYAFYGVEDDAALGVKMNTLLESCSRFLDFERIEVIPMSEYLLKTVTH
ncbi:MAG: hypothetical protein V7696_08630 [Halioglobus sp.]